MSLKYMLLSKIMTNNASDVHAIIHGKAGIKYAGVEVEAMRSLTEAHKDRSLKVFQACLEKYKARTFFLIEDGFCFSLSVYFSLGFPFPIGFEHS